MVRVKRPTRTKTSQRVNKDNDPSICLSGVNSEVEQHNKGNTHASSHNMNHDLEDRCYEHGLSTSNDRPVVEMDINEGISTDQLSKPCDVEINITASNPDSTTFNNLVEGMKLNSHRRSECRRKGSLLSVEPSETYYRRRKGFLQSLKPLKTYHRRRSGYVTLGISPLLTQNCKETKVEDMDICHPVKKPMLCVVKNTRQKEMSARGGESSDIAGTLVLEKDINRESQVNHIGAESENFSNPVLQKSTEPDPSGESMELDPSEKSDMIVACDVLVSEKNLNKSTSYIKNDASSLIISDTEQVERKQDDVEKASLVSSETMKQQRISQPGTAAVNLLPEEASSFSIKRKLLVLDINGLLADIVSVAHVSPEHKPKPETIISGKAVFKRPFCDEFLEFCFERFNVGVWSSRTKKNVGSVLDFLMGKVRQNLLFCWDQSHCTCTRYYTPDNGDKPLFFKKLNKLWENSENDLPWRKGDYDESNTLLLDDSPYKALLNPPNTAIFPHTYQYRNERDNSLGPGGDLRTYLEGLSSVPNVQEYVKQNSYGQDPISENHASWSFYHEVIESTVVGSLRKPYQSLGSPEKLRKDVSQVNNTSLVAETSKESLGSNGTFQQLENSIHNLLEAAQHSRRLMDNAKADGNFSGSPRGYKRGRGSSRSQSPRHERQSHSLSPKKCRRSKSPAPSHGSGFVGDKAQIYQNQTLRSECLNFHQGRCLRGTSCRFMHHQSHHQSYADRRVQEHEGQTFERISVPRECYDFKKGKCRWGASCRFLHSVLDKANPGPDGNQTYGDKQLADIRRDKAVPRECYDFNQGKCKWGASCRFLHSVPDKVDFGTEANETHDKPWENIRRDKAAHRVCNDFIQGKCNWGESCRFLHEKADFGPKVNETHGKQCYSIGRENAEPRECNDFIRGKCSWGASCRFLHSVPDKAGFATEADETHDKQRENIRRDKAVHRVCNDFIQGKCNYAESCRFLHEKADFGTEANETHGKQCYNIERENAEPRVCNDFTRGKCSWGASCRFLHSVPGKTDRLSSFHNSHYQAVPSSSKISDDCGEAQRSSVNEHGRYKALPEVCRNYTQGRCYRGPYCRYLHQELAVTVGSGPTNQLGDAKYKALRGVCRNYTQGICHKGADCPYLHQEPDLTGLGSTSQLGETSGFKSLPDICKNYTLGRCHKGSDCRFLHPGPSMGIGSGSTSQLGETNRFKAVPEVCRNNTLGRCHNGSNCRYLHQEIGLNFGVGSAQYGETSRYKSLPEVCMNFIQGRCHKGSDCRYLHQESGTIVGSGSTGQFDETSRGKAPLEVCRKYTQGRCHMGSNCRYLHQEQGSCTSKSIPDRCYDYTRGKCWRGVHCRYMHPEPDQIGNSRFYRSHQQDEGVSLNTKSFGSCDDKKGDTAETLPIEPINKESLREASTVPDDGAKDINSLENEVHLSMSNLGDSDRRILDADNISHERSVHEDTESGTKELIVDFSVNEEKRGTVEALPNHPICKDSHEQASVVLEDNTTDERVPEIVCASSMDNLVGGQTR